MAEDIIKQDEADVVPYKEVNPIDYDSDADEVDTVDNISEDKEIEEGRAHANLGGGWGRIIFSPVRRGRQVALDVCRSINKDGSEGSFEHIVVTKSRNPSLHHQARRSLWGDLWPF